MFFHRYTWMSCNFPSVNWFRNQSISSERAAEKFQLEKYFIEITKKYKMSSSSLIFPSPKIIFHLSEFFDVLWFMKVSFFKELCKWILMPNEIAKEFFRQFVKMPKWNPIFEIKNLFGKWIFACLKILWPKRTIWKTHCAKICKKIKYWPHNHKPFCNFVPKKIKIS